MATKSRKVARLLHHPERVFVREPCRVLLRQGGRWMTQEQPLDVVIPVDALRGNQDPYVFYKTWLYGYCRNANMPDAAPQSIVIFGTYLSALGKFLVDTVFVTATRTDWLRDGVRKVLQLSPNFEHQFTNDDPLYRQFLKWGVEHGHHFGKQRKNGSYSGAKWIFEAQHYAPTSPGVRLPPEARTDFMFSFIPLEMVHGIYHPIDIMPVLKARHPRLFDGFKGRRNRLYKEIDGTEMDIIRYLFQQATHLVTQTQGEGAPEHLDMDLQREYYKAVYDIEDASAVENCCFPDVQTKHQGDEENAEHSLGCT